MYYYKLYGMRLASDIQFPQLLVLSEEEQELEPQITILERPFPEEYKKEGDCYWDIEKDRSILSNSYGYLQMEQGERLWYEKKEMATEALLNAYLLGWGMAILIYQRGGLAIHCSCVEKDGQAVLISGNSGSGKSTLTKELLKQGYSLVADDMAVVEVTENGGLVTAPAFPYQKLCRDALEDGMEFDDKTVYIDEERDKFLVPYRGKFVARELPVKEMFILEPTNGREVQVRKLAGGEKLQACMDALFLTPLLGEKRYVPEHGIRMLEFAAKLPVYLVERPVGEDSRSALVRMVEKKG